MSGGAVLTGLVFLIRRRKEKVVKWATLHSLLLSQWPVIFRKKRKKSKNYHASPGKYQPHTHSVLCLRIWLKALLLHFIQATRCETLLTAAGSRHPRERIEKYINIELSILGQVWWMSSFCRDSLAEGGKLRKYFGPVRLKVVSLWSPTDGCKDW